MTAYLPPVVFGQEFDANGDPLVGGLLYTYVAGTTTPQVTYTDAAGTIPNTNPIVLDAEGRYAMRLGTGLAYKLVLKTSTGATIKTEDNITDSVFNAMADLANSSDVAKGDALIAVKQPFTGAVARTQHQTNQNFISAYDFGIVGDGTTNDTAAWNAMITAALPGWTILLHGLTIALSANACVMTSKSKITIDGHGATVKLLDPTTGTDPFILTMVTCSDITFKGVTFDAQVSTAAGNSRRAVWLKSGSDITFEDCDFSKCREGVYAGTSAGVGPSRVMVRRCRMVAELAYTATRADTDKSLPYFLADFVYGGADSIVEDCYTYGVGIPVYSEEGKGLKVVNNTFDTGWDSQVYVKGERLHVIGNRIYYAGKDAIKVVQTGANNAYRAIITNNHIEKFAMTRTDGSVGIHIQGRYHLVSDNLILLPTHSEAAGTGTLNGIIIGAQSAVVSDNQVIGAAAESYQSGIRIWPSSVESVKDVVISGNNLTGMRYAIITQTTTGVDIYNVKISGNYANGCWSLLYSSGNVIATSPKAYQFQITDNYCSDCVAYEIYLQNHNKPTVSNNTFTNCSGAEQIQLDGSLLCIITNNVSDGTNAALIGEANTPTYKIRHMNFSGSVAQESLLLRDGLTAPGASIANAALMYVDQADGDLKIRFADGTVKVIVADT